MSDTTTITTGPVGGRDELRTVALSAIEIRDGFNPRERFDDHELERLAASIARRGLLQPLIVTAGEQPGSYRLIAGERRYRACFAVGLTEVPVLVRPLACQDDVDDALIDAVAENLHRSDHTPLEEATAFARLLQAGLTRKGICEQLSVTRERVRDRLQLLEVPRELHGAIDRGEIPLAAVPALVQLAGIHPDLAACAYRQVTQPPRQSWQRPTTWADVAADPIGAVTTRYAGETPQLPDGVYEADASYPLASFPLSEKARRDLDHLAELDEVWAGEGPELMITPGMVEHAGTLSAAFCSPHNRSALIVGADVAGELAGALIAKRLKEERARARRDRERQTGTPQTAGADPDEEPLSEQDLERAKEQARQAEREAQRQARLDAEAYNDRVGAAIVKTLSTVKIDSRVIEVLTAVDLNGELDGIAMRGARYGFPGWVHQETTKAGKAKRLYLERPQALAKAHEYLAGAHSPGQIAGRCLALIAMAVLADEECVARSNRSGHSLYRYRTNHYDHGTPTGLAWARNAVSLLEEICVEQLPAGATERLRERREREQAERAQADAESQAAQAAYHDLAQQFKTLNAQQREAAIAAYEHEHPAGDFLLEQLQTHHEELNAAHASPSATHDTAAPVDTDGDEATRDAEEEVVAQAA
jgi:ParB/RepB/Spo0J family partition protein